MAGPSRKPSAGFWDRMAATPALVPVPEWQHRLLDERLAAHDADPEAGVPWKRVVADLRAKYRPAR
jgi:putative addiction module component (TIGR02574 family)